MVADSHQAGEGDSGADAGGGIRARVIGTNINAETLLATDYLNHFNEVVMLLEMLPDMPECLDDVKAWRPKTYVEHFRDSSFSDAALAIEAYAEVPAQCRARLEDVIGSLNRMILDAVAAAEAALAEGDTETLQHDIATVLPGIRSYQDRATSIINGVTLNLDQSDIDSIIAP